VDLEVTVQKVAFRSAKRCLFAERKATLVAASLRWGVPGICPQKLGYFPMFFGRQNLLALRSAICKLYATNAAVFSFGSPYLRRALPRSQPSRTGTGEAVVGKSLDDTRARIQKSYRLAAEARRVAEETRRLVEDAQRSLARPKRPRAIALPSNNGRPTE